MVTETDTNPEASGGVPLDIRMRAWLSRHAMRFAVLESGTGARTTLTLIENPRGKRLSFAVGAIRAVDAALDAHAGGDYLRIMLDDGRSFALSKMGFVFAPRFEATGPLPDCPATACFIDYDRILSHLQHLAQPSHASQHDEALRVFFVLLAFLNGARAIGLDVEEEEETLEAILERLERISGRSSASPPPEGEGDGL
ncbi:MAG: hypothetical protein H6729_17355 [Deltaproteobacteria bacterium]|nr:hypothetical protein [Deltaproteobacteria bacterium]